MSISQPFPLIILLFSFFFTAVVHASSVPQAALEERRAIAESGAYQASEALATSPRIDPASLIEALDVPAEQVIAAWTNGSQASAGAFDELGVIQPREGNTFVVLSTGIAGTPEAAPGADLSGSDETTITIELEPPASATHVAFRFRFMTAEYPAFSESGYNDQFTATLSDSGGSREIVGITARDNRVYPVSASTAEGSGFDLFAADPRQFNTEFGNGLPASGMTDWITVREALRHDGPITLEFRVRDQGDDLMDSAVILDDLSADAASIHMAPRRKSISPAQTDPGDVLVNCVSPPAPVPVDGAVADGATRLLFTVQTPGPGHVKYSLSGSSAPEDGGFTESFDSEDRLDEIEVSVVNGLGQTLYLVPEDFNRGGDEGSSERLVTVRAEYIPDGAYPAFETFLRPKLKRPGVVFAHGLWSNPGDAWSETPLLAHPFVLESGAITFRRANYIGTNAAHFETNRLMLDTWLAQVCTDLRGEGLAMRQADVIGHSMGGILGRVYEATRPTLINRLITLNTPHFGSSWANALLALRDNPDLLVRFITRRVFDSLGKPISDGAIDDLAVGSNAINSLPATSIPSHAMVGVGGKFITDPIVDGSIAGPTGPLLWFFGLRPSDVFDTPEHDLVVGRDSQIGGIPPGATSIFEGFPDSLHWNATKSESYSDRILTTNGVSLLNAQTDGLLYGHFPSPSAMQTASPNPHSGISTTDDEPELPLVEFLTPADGAAFVAGESFTVTVDEPADFESQRVLLVTEVHSQGMDTAPFSAEFTIPLEFVGELEMTAFATDDLGGFAASEAITLLVEAPAELMEIEITTPDPTIFPFENQRRISVSGIYADDINRDISDSSTGTVYASSNPSVATISEDGQITPIEEGFTTVIAQNGPFQDSISVRVLERDPPLPEIVDVDANPEELWPPTNRMVPVDLTVTANGSPVNGCAVAEVSANEGNPASDIAITGDLTLELRASRLGTEKGRRYTIEVGCSSGNVTSAGTAEVVVPHDQRP
ncbi:alpha/beta fold hydrolase [Wenzhouxiangella sp. EGI_FJ10305]|uniref:alpha/beta fold hydrolase n=1 Tax=Wenzhouxiangella sp. EGI_FJ10305 TaxID=3243768 RepID=UPI0035D5A2EB